MLITPISIFPRRRGKRFRRAGSNRKKPCAAEPQSNSKPYSPQRREVVQRSEYFLIKNSLLGVLSASALKIVADPSFGGSAVSPLLDRPVL